MEEVKRYLHAYDGMVEHPQGDNVPYADYVFLKAWALELEQQNDALKARVAELEREIVNQRTELICADAERDSLKAGVAELEGELERTRVQLAGCGVAALGYADDAKRGDYGYSASLGDVLQLRRETVSLRAQLEAAKQATRDANFDRNLAQLTAQPDGDLRDVIRDTTRRIQAVRSFLKERGNSRADACRSLSDIQSELDQALTAAPAREDGVREILEKLSRLGNGDRPGNSEGNVLAQDALRLLDSQALAAPAPAPRCICTDMGPQSYEGPLRDCPVHGEKAPAPACKTCGGEGYVFHELDLSKPCPDCAKGEL